MDSGVIQMKKWQKDSKSSSFVSHRTMGDTRSVVGLGSECSSDRNTEQWGRRVGGTVCSVNFLVSDVEGESE